MSLKETCDELEEVLGAIHVYKMAPRGVIELHALQGWARTLVKLGDLQWRQAGEGTSWRGPVDSDERFFALKKRVEGL